MSIWLPVKRFWTPAALLLAAAAPLAQDRLVINVREAQSATPSKKVIHYEGTGSVRLSEERSYTSAQSRQSTQEAASRREAAEAQERRTAGSQTRTAADAGVRTHRDATERGSVRLDTIR